MKENSKEKFSLVVDGVKVDVTESLYNWYLLSEKRFKRKTRTYYSVLASLDYVLENGKRYIDIIADEKADSPEKILLDNEQKKVEPIFRINLGTYLKKLEPEKLDLLFRKFVLGQSIDVIAGETGIPRSTVNYRIHAALKKLRRMIEFDERKFAEKVGQTPKILPIK